MTQTGLLLTTYQNKSRIKSLIKANITTHRGTHMKHQFRGFRIFLLGLAVLAAVGPAPVSGRTTQPAPQQTQPAQGGGPMCDWPSWSCSGVNYGSTPPANAPKITYIGDYQSVLSCLNDISVSQALPGSGKVKLNCPNWPELEPEVNRACPTNEVLREPYPRALVTVPITFTLIATTTPILNFANAGPPSKNDAMPKSNGVMLVHGAAGIVSIKVRGTRLDANTTWFNQLVISPTWTFQDRNWVDNPKYKLIQRNISATYQYEASSYGLLEKGRGYDVSIQLPANNYDLPAYPVQMATPCKFEYQLVVQKHWPYWTFNAPPILDANGKRTNNAGKWNTQWVNVTTAWTGINMKSYGYPNTYEWWDVVRSGGKLRGIVYWDQPEPSKIWVPVLEIQTVLRSLECGTGGKANCPPAEPESITPPSGGPGGVGSTGTGSLTSGGGGGSIINPPPP
jgi:hypothetical protein